MFYKYILQIAIFLLLSVGSFAQLDEVFIGSKDLIAFKHINELKGGVLLVRLQTQSRAIRILESKKRYREAEILKKRNLKQNKGIVKAFKSAYKFSEVYFFYSQDSDRIRARDFTGVFRDDSLQVIKENVPISADSNFYIVDFGLVYFASFGEYFEGVAVMNSDFELLDKPFPYYVRKRSGMAILKRSDADMVIKLQSNFEKYYNKSLKYAESTTDS